MVSVELLPLEQALAENNEKRAKRRYKNSPLAVANGLFDLCNYCSSACSESVSVGDPAKRFTDSTALSQRAFVL